jgi:hypothetical protein
MTILAKEGSGRIDYTLRRPLAQFARGAVVQEFSARIGTTFATNIEARLSGSPVPTERSRSVGTTLMLRALWRRLRAVLDFGRSDLDR